MGLVYRSLARFSPERRAELQAKATATLGEWGIAGDPNAAGCIGWYRVSWRFRRTGPGQADRRMEPIA